MRRLPRLAVMFAVSLFSTGCAHKVMVRMDWVQPPRLTLPQGAAVFIDGHAAPVDGVDVVDGVLRADLGQVVRQVAKGASLPTLEQEFKTRLVQARFQTTDKNSAQYAVRLTPTYWAYNASGRMGLDGTGKLDVRVTVVDLRNASAPPLYDDTIWGRAGSRGLGEVESMARCADAIAGEFLTLFSPSTGFGRFELDDEDPAVEQGIDLARDGLMDGAYDAFFAAVRANPQSAPALYDFAVMSGVKGNLDEAERLMTEATRFQQKKLYYRALEIVRGARQERDAASTPPPGAPAATPAPAPSI